MTSVDDICKVYDILQMSFVNINICKCVVDNICNCVADDICKCVVDDICKCVVDNICKCVLMTFVNV